MSAPFRRLSRSALVALADALETGQNGPPFSPLALRHFAGSADASTLAGELQRRADAGMLPHHLAFTLRLLAEERDEARASECIELVWSGPEGAGALSRDTSVVVRELFSDARRSVLVSGYAVYQGRVVFRALAENLDRAPDLQVRMFLNVQRQPRDDRPASVLLREYAEAFCAEQWPGARLPKVFYDARALSSEIGPRACLHAKCIVVDDARAFVTSANFTEAAHERNIEAGVLVESPAFAKALSAQFETLVEQRTLLPVPGVG